MIPGELDYLPQPIASTRGVLSHCVACILLVDRDRPTVFCRLSTGNGFCRLRVTEQAAVDRAIGAYRQDVGDR